MPAKHSNDGDRGKSLKPLHLCKHNQAEQSQQKEAISPFHGGNTGSNPVGDAKSNQNDFLKISGLGPNCVSLPQVSAQRREHGLGAPALSG
jgi:hypothetical protein